MNRSLKPKGRRSRSEVLKSYGRHLIYSEGSKTEPLYNENIKRVIEENYKFHNTKIEIEITPHQGLNTLGLVDFAESDVKKRLRSKEKIDYVWIFFDKDSFPNDQFENAHNKIIKKNKNNLFNDDGDAVDNEYIRWFSIWSNECFELWVLLHFMYFDSKLSREDYIPKINNYLKPKKYEKNNTSLYDLLLEKGDIKNAIRFARRLRDANNINSPSTGVYQFIEYFEKYLRIK